MIQFIIGCFITSVLILTISLLVIDIEKDARNTGDVTEKESSLTPIHCPRDYIRYHADA